MSRKITNQNIESICGLTPLQKGMVYHKMMEEQSTEYVIQDSLLLEQPVCDEYFVQSVELLVYKYEAFRTVFMYKNASVPRQIVLKEKKSDITIHDFVGRGDCQNEIDQIKEMDIARGFDLERDILFRAILIKTAEDHNEIFFTSHHIITDGWCNSLIFKDFIDYYQMLDSGQKIGRIKEKIDQDRTNRARYCDYVEMIEKKDHQLAALYFKELLDGYDQAAIIRPAAEPTSHTKQIKTSEVFLDHSLSDRLNQVAAQNNLTMNTIYETIWGIVLQKFVRTDDIVFGKVVSGRDAELIGIEEIVGLFINTIPVRVNNPGTVSALEVMNKQQIQAASSSEYDYCALVDIQNGTTLKRELFHTIFAFENYYIDESLTDGQLPLKIKLNSSREETNYPISVTVFCGDQVNISIMYDAGKYTEENIVLLLRCYEQLLESFAENSDCPVQDLTMLSDMDRQLVLETYNDTEMADPHGLPDENQSIMTLFEEQVKNTPDRIALRYQDCTLTYLDVKEKVDILADRLTRMGVKRNDFVAVIADRSIEVVIGIFGILKAGAAYVPIDKDYPGERIDYILKDCQPKAVLVYHATVDTEIPVIDLEQSETWVPPTNHQAYQHQPCINQSGDYMYCIYTSGTTGEPKGVINIHSTVYNLVQWLQREYPLSAEDVISFKSTYVFDASVSELFWWCCAGSTLSVIEPNGEKDVDIIADTIARDQVTMINFVPSMLSAFLAGIGDQKALIEKTRSLKYVFAGGEILNKKVIDKFYDLLGDRNPRLLLINAYGPTEATVYTTCHNCYKGMDTVPIGRPIGNAQIYILNNNQLCPAGVPGEIFISGKGLALGYLNQQEMTDTKFVDCPFRPAKMYRSGDLGCWRFDGTVDYLGRIDEQVKIRGFRIELGEVETAIRRDPRIKDAAVIARADKTGDKAIYGYFVSDQLIDLKQLRERLYEYLPSYMVPAYLTAIDTIPITGNGKINRKALPDIENNLAGEHVLPTTAAEKILCEILCNVLGRERVGIKDNFFELGGDSIKAIRVVSKMREAGFDLSVKDIMGKPDVEALALRALSSQTFAPKYEQGEVTGRVLSIPIIREFEQSGLAKPNHFNQSVMLNVTGITFETIRTVLHHLTIHHDLLRAVYLDGILEVKELAGQDWYRLDKHDLRGQEDHQTKISEYCNEIQQNIDLKNGPLLLSGYFDCGAQQYLMICIHHLVVDHVSWSILLEDFMTISNQIESGHEVVLPAKTASFIDWGIALNEYQTSKLFLQEKDYWRKLILEMEQCPAIATTNNVERSEIETIELKWEKELTEKLLADANKSHNTQTRDLLVSALALAIGKAANVPSTLITLEGHGREPIHKRIDIDRTVGWFTSLYPVLLECQGSIESTIIYVKDYLNKIPNHGMGYGLLDEEKPDLQIPIYFNYLGEMEESSNSLQVYNISTGAETAPENGSGCRIFINIMIEEKQLYATVTYDKSEFEPKFIKALSMALKDSVTSVTRYCTDKETVTRTITDYSAPDLSVAELGIISSYCDLLEDVAEDIYSLTPLQEGMMYHNTADENSSEYLIQNVVAVNHCPDPKLIRATLDILTEKYEVLRTAVLQEGLRKPRQIILRNRKIPIERIELKQGERVEDQLEEIIRSDASNNFKLSKEPLIRLKCIELPDGSSKMIWTYHHIIMDGWCTSLLFGDFADLYQRLRNGEQFEILKNIARAEKQETASYSDYVKYIEESNSIEGLEYWRKLLENYQGYTDIKPIKPVRDIEKRVETQQLLLPASRVEQIKDLAVNQAVTVNCILESVWGVLLQKYNCQEDVVFGKVVSGRNVNLRGIENMLGLFINTIPLRVKSTGMRVSDLIKQVQQQNLESGNFEHISLADLQTQTDLGNGQIKTLFIFENYYINEEKTKTSFFDVEYSREQTNYEITMTVTTENNQLGCDLMYNPLMYQEFEITSLLERFDHILGEFVKDPKQQISEIEFITAAEYNHICTVFNDTITDYDKDSTMADFFEAIATNNQDHPALVYQDREMTYGQLNKKTNALAKTLRQSGVAEGDFVPIIAGRGFEMIIGVLGILKAGAAYVPILPDYPVNRIEYIISDCSAGVVLTDQFEHPLTIPVLRLGDLSLYEQDESNLIRHQNRDSSAYCMYTSGTTGQPKGVLIRHGGVAALRNYLFHGYDVRPEDHVLQFTNFVFDLSVWEFTMSLLLGSTLILIDKEIIADVNLFNEFVNRSGITRALLTPQYFLETDFKGIKTLATGASATNMEVVHKAANCLEYVNAYGPTEATVIAANWRQDYRTDSWKDMESVPIGKPMPNYQMYIVNGLKLCGIGMIGELCIAGDALARGYLNLETLTNEKFIPNPFAPGKMYRTGDYARWLPDGNIEYLGRIDDQVKIRGFRIELSEIEHVLRSQERIRDAAVIVIEDDNKDQILCAYISGHDPVDLDALRVDLARDLPSYMIPTHIMELDTLPLTVNGKLDRKALPAVLLQNQSEYVAPATATEKTICNIFEQILNLETIGMKDNFFDMGGHSLRANRLVNYLEAETGVRIMIKDIFQNPTPELLAALVTANLDTEGTCIPKADPAEYFEMSSPQTRIYLISQMDERNCNYNIPLGLRITGVLDVVKLRQTLQAMVDRHEILRTQFLIVNEKPVQRILNQVDVELIVEENRSDCQTKLLNDFIKPFDLDAVPLHRFKLIDRGNEYIFLMDIHHIIFDAASAGLFLAELTRLYNAEPLDVVCQYKDFSEWMKQQDFSRQKAHWLSVFSGEIPVLDLPLDYQRPLQQSFDGEAIGYTIDSKMVGQIRRVAKETQTTEYMVFLSAAMVLLSKYSHQQEIIIGSPISGRVHKDTEAMLGMFVNTLAMKGNIDASQSFAELLSQIKDYCLKAYENQDYPFEELVEQIDVVRDQSRNPLFDVMLVLQNNEQMEYQLAGAEAEYLELNSNTAKFDLTFQIIPDQDGYAIMLEYCTALFKESTVSRMLEHYIAVLNQLTTDCGIRIAEVETSVPSEQKKILTEFNHEIVAVGSDQTIASLLKEQCNRCADATAVQFEEQVMTYRELESKSDALAARLISMGVKPEDFVAVFAQKGIEVIVALCAIVKAGAAYVPIDTKYPADRVRMILADCQPKVLLKYQTDLDLNEQLPQLELDLGELSGSSHPLPVVRPQQLAYMIYTSGTTGRPKGVLIEQRSVVNLIRNNQYNDLNQDTCILQTGSLAFDASTFEIWGALLNGGTLHLMSEDNLFNFEYVRDYIVSQQINTMFMTTALFNQIIKTQPDTFDTMSNFLIGGEKASRECVELLVNRNLPLNFKHVYGPTETTTFATWYSFNNSADPLYIGRPLSNVQAYIMDGNQLCGIGVKGELLIGGLGVSRGYLNDPILTAEKFIDHPLGSGKLYRSGDLARWSEDGYIEYLGRIDQQVKIRGFRIELSDIESHIRNLPDIQDVAVIVREYDGEKKICAYLVADQLQDLSVVRESLAQELPEYMLPSYLLQIDVLELNNSGKLDVNALPVIEQQSMREYAAPRNEIEQLLCNIFEETLGIGRVGIKDSFFEIGGDSIKAIRIVSKIREAGFKISVKDILKYGRIEAISVAVTVAEMNSYEQGEVSGEVGYLPIVDTFARWNLKVPEHFNQAVMIKFADEEEATLQTILNQLVQHHDALRSVYRDGVLRILTIADSKTYDFYRYDVRNEAEDVEKVTDICTLLQSSINLSEGPLMKVALFRTRNGNYLMIAIHHLVVDGVSWRILMEDFNTLMRQAQKQEAFALPQKTASVIEWSQALDEYKNSKKFKEEEQYWNQKIIEIRRLQPANEATYDMDSASSYNSLEISFDQQLTQQLVYEAPKAFKTEINDLLLRAAGDAFCKQFQKEQVVIGLEGHGREEIHKNIDIGRTIGWFTSMYPVLINRNEDIRKHIISVKEMLRKIPNHGMGYGLMPQESNEPDLYFNYLGELDSENSNIEFGLYSAGISVAEENRMPGRLNFNGNISGGELSFLLTYDTRYFTELEMDSFTKLFKESMWTTVQCCLDEKDEIITISDVDETLSEDDLSAIHSILSF